MDSADARWATRDRPANVHVRAFERRERLAGHLTKPR
jgi:hypothetical protein